MDRNLTPRMIYHIEGLVDASCSGRDKLYAAADTLDDQRWSDICKTLADDLAGHANELRQLLIVNGADPMKPFDMYDVAESFLQLTKNRDGEVGVLSVAGESERTVKEQFDDVLEVTRDDAATGDLLQRQRNNILFGERVLRTIQVVAEGEIDSGRR